MKIVHGNILSAKIYVTALYISIDEEFINGNKLFMIIDGSDSHKP